MRSPLIFGTTRARPENRYQPITEKLIEIGGQRARGDAAHAELRDRAKPEAERAAQDDLADRGR